MAKEVTLEEYVKNRISEAKSKYRVLRQVYSDVTSGRLRLIDPSPPRDFMEYLVRLDYASWFWTIIVVVLTTLVTVYLSDTSSYLKYARYILGSMVVLFIPGYVTIEALYPGEKDLTPLERLALSIGLSLALIPLIGLILNYTPWGIRLNPILASLSAYILVILLVAAYQKYRVYAKTRTQIISITR